MAHLVSRGFSFMKFRHSLVSATRQFSNDHGKIRQFSPNHGKIRQFSHDHVKMDSKRSASSVLSEITATFVNAEVPEAEISARYLLEEVLKPSLNTREVERLRLEGDVEGWVGEEESTRLDTMVLCRLARMPVQYIVGSWQFRDITLAMRPPVFIPRPETEQLVEIILEEMGEGPLRLLEIGPGSGAISLSLLKSRADLLVTAVERSKDACQLTKENAVALGVDDRLKVINDTVEDDKNIEGIDEEYDLIVSNPPYILRKDLMNLAPEITVFEDLRALNGGNFGLDVILDIVKLSRKLLKPGGKVYLEVDPCHPHLLPPKLGQLPQPHFSLQSVHTDFNEKERFVILVKDQL